MGDESEVIVYGRQGSPYVKRVELALKVKGIPYDYVEEDLLNKSPLLLKYNPIHKKVPVLVHNGKPVTESSVILEYIDETWKDKPRLFPEDPYERAQVRLWDSYIHQVIESRVKIYKGKEVEKAVNEYYGKLMVLEEGIKNSSTGINTDMDGRNMGMLDILILVPLGSYKVQEEVFGVKLLDPEKIPLLYSWLTALSELPIVKETAVPHHKLLSFYRYLKGIHQSS